MHLDNEQNVSSLFFFSEIIRVDGNQNICLYSLLQTRKEKLFSCKSKTAKKGTGEHKRVQKEARQRLLSDCVHLEASKPQQPTAFCFCPGQKSPYVSSKAFNHFKTTQRSRN